MKLRQERFYCWLLWGVGEFEWQKRGGGDGFKSCLPAGGGSRTFEQPHPFSFWVVDFLVILTGVLSSAQEKLKLSTCQIWCYWSLMNKIQSCSYMLSGRFELIIKKHSLVSNDHIWNADLLYLHVLTIIHCLLVEQIMKSQHYWLTPGQTG